MRQPGDAASPADLFTVDFHTPPNFRVDGGMTEAAAAVIGVRFG